MTKIKICGLSRPCDVDYVNAARPDYCGFIIGFPASKRNVTMEQLRMLRARLRPDIVPVGVFVDAPEAFVAELYGEGLICVAQLHGHEDNGYITRLRALMDRVDEAKVRGNGQCQGRIRIIQAFKVRTDTDADECFSADAVRQAEMSAADMVLLDGGAGDGRTFDWSVLSNLRRPYILAGGLGPDNIEAAIQAVRPWAVDMSSGVETDGFKDEHKIMEVVNKIRCM